MAAYMSRYGEIATRRWYCCVQWADTRYAPTSAAESGFFVYVTMLTLSSAHWRRYAAFGLIAPLISIVMKRNYISVWHGNMSMMSSMLAKGITPIPKIARPALMALSCIALRPVLRGNKCRALSLSAAKRNARPCCPVDAGIVIGMAVIRSLGARNRGKIIQQLRRKEEPARGGGQR